MPSTSVITEGNQLFRSNEKMDAKEPVSNFSISLLAPVHVSSDAGGPGILMRLQRYPGNTKK